jgi:hypothetical protein
VRNEEIYGVRNGAKNEEIYGVRNGAKNEAKNEVPL